AAPRPPAPPAQKAGEGPTLEPVLRGERLGLVAHSESWYPRYHYGWSELQSVQDGRFKYIRAPRPELYDLPSDPRELQDLSTAEAARLPSLEQALATPLARTTSATAAKGPQTVD